MPAHHVDSLRHADQTAQLWHELCQLRRAVADHLREIDREPPEPARVALTLDVLRRLVGESDKP